MTGKSLDRIICIAHSVALLSRYGSYRFGSAILLGKRVISVGVNTRKTHPNGSGPNLAIHAELDAARIAESRIGSIRGATIAIARAGRDDGYLPSFPCAGCFDMIRRKGLRRMLYIGNDLTPHYVDIGKDV